MQVGVHIRLPLVPWWCCPACSCNPQQSSSATPAVVATSGFDCCRWHPPAGSNPDASLLLSPLLCSGADHRLAAWDALTLKEVWRTKLDAKAPLTSLTYSQR